MAMGSSENGDIWAAYQNIVQGRGHRSIRATKVKAHQDDKSKLNATQLLSAIGNDHADNIAKDARRYHREALKQYI